MKFISYSIFSQIGVGLTLIFFACLPIWSVENYFNQDGSPHLYNAYILLELFKGNPAFTQVFEFNSFSIPNSSGHYLLTLLLLFFSPNTVTKIMATVLFTTFVAAVGWLRKQVVEDESSDFLISLLIGAALSFNWMWFLGFYNFIIGVIGFTFTLGLYWRWREHLSFFRSVVLSVLLIVVFFSHLISFGMLIGSIFCIAFFTNPANRKKTLLWTIATVLPVIPLITGYKITADQGGQISPIWRYLHNPFQLSNWAAHIQTADPFQLLSRKALPFFEGTSVFFAIFVPFLWLVASLLFLVMATRLFYGKKNFISQQNRPFLIIFAGSIIFWIFAPDDLGKTHGGFLRERVLLCGLVCFVPLFRIGNAKLLKYASVTCLIFIICFQTLVLWNYSFDANKLGKEFMSGQSLLSDDDSFGSIVLTDTGCRYKSNPLPSMGTLYGIGKNTRIWDNYEAGYYLFPTTLKNPSERQFINEFREASNFDLCSSEQENAEKFSKLNSILELNNDKIKILLVWGDDPRILPIISQWYDSQPFHRNGRVRLFRHL